MPKFREEQAVDEDFLSPTEGDAAYSPKDSAANSIPPAGMSGGWIWYDSGKNRLMVYNGGAARWDHAFEPQRVIASGISATDIIPFAPASGGVPVKIVFSSFESTLTLDNLTGPLNWSNVGSTPTTIDDYGLVDAARSDVYNGSVRGPVDAVATVSGSTVSVSLEQAGGGNLIMCFSDGETTLVTPPLTAIMTAGTDVSPTEQFVYILKSDKLLTVGADWPIDIEHIKVS